MFGSARSNCRIIATLCGLVVVACLGSVACAQQFVPATIVNAKQFVGTWKGSFEGHPFLTVTVAIDGTRLVGSLSHADIEVDKAGELTKADASEGEDPIASFLVSGDTLRIAVKSADNSEGPIQSELKLVGANEAELRLLAPPDVPAPKPWRLKRVAETP